MDEENENECSWLNCHNLAVCYAIRCWPHDDGMELCEQHKQQLKRHAAEGPAFKRKLLDFVALTPEVSRPD